LKRLLFLVCTVMIGTIILACSFTTISSSECWVTAYYLFGSNSIKNYLVPVKILVDPGLSREDLVYLVFEMIKYPPCKSLYSVIPEELSLLGIEFNGELVTMNFTAQIEEIGGLGIAGAFIDQLTWSVLEIEGLEKIAFKVEGKLVSDITSEGIFVEGGIPKNLKTVEIVPFSKVSQSK
jgi:spore germination protein GerM